MLIEALDSRVMLASAPPTVLGISADVTVTGGNAPLVTAGSFAVSIGTNARDYKITGGDGVTDSEGTYAYRVVKPKVGELKLNDTTVGELTATFTFATPTTGTVAAVRMGGGSLTGTFTLSGPDFAFVQGVRQACRDALVVPA